MIKKLKIIGYLIRLLIFILIISCDFKGNYIKDVKYTRVSFELSDKDSNIIGLPSGDFEIGPTNMIISGNIVYFLDPYFSEVRSLNLENKNLSTSLSFSIKNHSKYSWIPWLYDLTFFNDNLYVINDTDSIFILDKNLKLLNSLNIGLKGKKYVYYNFVDSLQIYSMRNNEILTINSKNICTHINSIEYSPIKEINNKYYGLNYSYQPNNDIFITDFWKIKLNEKIQNITQLYYQCKNIAFNKDYFIHFDIDQNDNKINFYIYKIN